MVFNLINSFFVQFPSDYPTLETTRGLTVHKRVVNNPIKMCRDGSSNYYLDNLNMNNFIKKNDVKTNNFINTIKIIDDMLIEKNLTKIILNLRKDNHSLYYINNTNNIETITSSNQLSSKLIKNIIFTDLNKVMLYNRYKSYTIVFLEVFSLYLFFLFLSNYIK